MKWETLEKAENQYLEKYPPHAPSKAHKPIETTIETPKIDAAQPKPLNIGTQISGPEVQQHKPIDVKIEMSKAEAVRPKAINVATEISVAEVQQPTAGMDITIQTSKILTKQRKPIDATATTSEAEAGLAKPIDVGTEISRKEVQHSKEENDITIETSETRPKSFEPAATKTSAREVPPTGNSRDCHQAQQRSSPREWPKPSNSSFQDQISAGVNNASSAFPSPAVHDNSQQEASDTFDPSVADEQVATCAECLSILTDYEDDDEPDGCNYFGGNEIDPESINMLLAAAEATTECNSESENQRQTNKQLAAPSFGQSLNKLPHFRFCFHPFPRKINMQMMPTVPIPKPPVQSSPRVAAPRSSTADKPPLPMPALQSLVSKRVATSAQPSDMLLKKARMGERRFASTFDYGE